MESDNKLIYCLAKKEMDECSKELKETVSDLIDEAYSDELNQYNLSIKNLDIIKITSRIIQLRRLQEKYKEA